MSRLANRYAKALFLAAEARKATDVVARDLDAVAATLREPAVRALVLDPDTPAVRRKRVLDELGSGRHELTRNLFAVLLARHRQELLPELPAAFQDLCMQHRGQVRGLLETAHPLSRGSLEALEATANALAGKTVVLSVTENPDLVGGVRLRVGNTLYDSSVATAIDELERRLMSAPI